MSDAREPTDPTAEEPRKIIIVESASDEDEGPPAQEEGAEPVQLSYAEYEELTTLARERDEYLKRLQRAVADYQNLQKRIDKFRDMARHDLLRSLTEAILPVADSLCRALEAAEQTEGGGEMLEGLRLVEKEFYAALDRLDIRPIQAVGQKFDPHYHHAVMQTAVEGAPPSSVVQELKRGFTLGEQVVRPSQVIVAAGPDQEATAQS